MISLGFAILCTAASLASAKTPSGFAPSSNTDLVVLFGNSPALNGVVVSKAVSASAPTVATTKRLNGTSFAVIMVDLDVPTNQASQTATLLHWMQTGLTASTTASTLALAAGNEQVFVLQNKQNVTAFAPYFGPSPPARAPLSHRYTQVLVDMTGASQAATAALQAAAKTRNNFSVDSVLQQAGLQGKVLAGNFFNVTNDSSGATNSSGSTSGNNQGSSGSKANATTTSGGGQRSSATATSAGGRATVTAAGGATLSAQTGVTLGWIAAVAVLLGV